jgi:hypothetical protein
VLAFLVLFFSLLALAFSQLACLIRTETVRAQTLQRDQGTIPALARGLALMETGYPPTTPYACGVTIDTPSGPIEYTVTFTSQGAGNWSVQSAPTTAEESPPQMPLVFTAQLPP